MGGIDDEIAGLELDLYHGFLTAASHAVRAWHGPAGVTVACLVGNPAPWPWLSADAAGLHLGCGLGFAANFGRLCCA